MRLMDSQQMVGMSATDQAKRAIVHTLQRIREHPEVGYYMGCGTQTFDLLTEAASTLFDEPIVKVRESFMPLSPRDPYNTMEAGQ
jgi:hypothetical protein